MARVFRVTIDLYPPSEHRPDFCIESYEQVRTAEKNRVLHFGMKESPTADDVAWVCEVIGTQIQSLVGRTVGIQTALDF